MNFEEQFLAEFDALLKKYGASFEVEYAPYNVRAVVYIPSKWDEDGKLVQDFTEVDLGTYRDAS